MSKVKKMSLLMLAAGLTLAGAAELSKKQPPDKPAFSIRRLDQQTVLYTIHRGSYNKIGDAVGRLFALAGQKGIRPRGPVSYAYLNNPNLVSSNHWLTEIRIPVGKEALKLAGTLGEMTDVKALPAMEVAVAVKHKGQADPSPIYDNLARWVFEQGYMPAGGFMETFLTNAMAGNYAQMKSEIILPVRKFSQNRN